MNRLVLLLTAAIAAAGPANAQRLADYRLQFDKRGRTEANIGVECSFTLWPEEADTVVLALGGGAAELAVDGLHVEGGNLSGWDYDYDAHTLTLYPAAKGPMTVGMRYDYTNLGTFFIYGQSGAEIWETSFGECYYPHIPDRHIDIAAEFRIPDSLELIAAYPTEKTSEGGYRCRVKDALAQSLSFALIRRDLYVRRSIAIPDTVEVWQLRGKEASNARVEELERLAAASIAWFGEVYGEKYRSEELGFGRFPVFLFHGGKGFANRNNVGFISASQEKFAQAPDIWPLVHEIGHRWLGEWTLLIPDGEPGAYFIKESLNEYMTLQFIRHYAGQCVYAGELAWCAKEWGKIAGTEHDRPLIEMTQNNNDTVVYRKGPLLLDALAQRFGYEAVTEAIAAFYRAWRGRPGLTYEHFIGSLRGSDAALADAADRAIRFE